MRNRALLYALAAVMAATALAFVVRPHDWTQVERPTDGAGLARWIARHPADWLAASAIGEQSLDLSVSRRRDLWRASHELARMLAPLRKEPAIAFARSGLFHWYELDANDRAAVLGAIEPLLRDPALFRQMHRPIWELTADLGLLRRANPGTAEALVALRDIAVTNGRFDDYRALREASTATIRNELAGRLPSLTPVELLHALPPLPYHVSDDPIFATILGDLQHRPLDASPGSSDRLEAFVDYTIRHHVGPLEGLEALTRMPESLSDPLRARLALAIDLPDRARQIELTSSTQTPSLWIDYHRERAAFESRRGDARAAEIERAKVAASHVPEDWEGRCGELVCTAAHRSVVGPSAVTVTPVASDEVPAYVELYIDDALVVETALTAPRTFEVPSGEHRVEVRIANPFTRNGERRTVKI